MAGRFNGQTGDKIKTVLDIAFTVLIALAFAVVCLYLIVLFFKIAFLPLGIKLTVQLLCLIFIAADIVIAKDCIRDILSGR
ncbi:MAG: hypothetical protein RR829_00995 [Oscillospiraceae bacterium]